MSGMVEAGRWVRVHRIELTVGERAPGIPADTAAVPFESFVNGRLLEAASLGGAAVVETASGRRVAGRLVEVEPGYTHSFGPPPAPLREAGRGARNALFG